MIKKSRLKKIASPITLYHGTSFDNFLKILNDGQLRMSGDIEAPSFTTSPDSPKSHYFLPTRPDNVHQIISLTVEKIMGWNGNPRTIVHRDLDDYIRGKLTRSIYKQTKQQNPDASKKELTKITQETLAKTSIEVGVLKRNSNDINGVYLATEDQASRYARSGEIEHGNYDCAVLLKINTEEDALGADYNHSKMDKNDPRPPWKYSLDTTKQCIQHGPIFLDQIEAVKYLSVSGQANEKYYVFTKGDEYLTEDKWISLSEATEMAQNLVQAQESGEEFSVDYLQKFCEQLQDNGATIEPQGANDLPIISNMPVDSAFKIAEDLIEQFRYFESWVDCILSPDGSIKYVLCNESSDDSKIPNGPLKFKYDPYDYSIDFNRLNNLNDIISAYSQNPSLFDNFPNTFTSGIIQLSKLSLSFNNLDELKQYLSQNSGEATAIIKLKRLIKGK